MEFIYKMDGGRSSFIANVGKASYGKMVMFYADVISCALDGLRKNMLEGMGDFEGVLGQIDDKEQKCDSTALFVVKTVLNDYAKRYGVDLTKTYEIYTDIVTDMAKEKEE